MIAGNIVILQRGVVSFASKVPPLQSILFSLYISPPQALRAAEAGAAAVIISQTMDMWPFMMTDSAGEVANAVAEESLSIPVLMISKKDSELVLKLVTTSHQSSTLSAGTPSPSLSELLCRIRCGSILRDCSICQDTFSDTSEILKLPCRHLYHSDCVTEWLTKVFSSCR